MVNMSFSMYHFGEDIFEHIILLEKGIMYFALKHFFQILSHFRNHIF